MRLTTSEYVEVNNIEIPNNAYLAFEFLKHNSTQLRLTEEEADLAKKSLNKLKKYYFSIKNFGDQIYFDLLESTGKNVETYDTLHEKIIAFQKVYFRANDIGFSNLVYENVVAGSNYTLFDLYDFLCDDEDKLSIEEYNEQVIEMVLYKQNINLYSRLLPLDGPDFDEICE